MCRVLDAEGKKASEGVCSLDLFLNSLCESGKGGGVTYPYCSKCKYEISVTQVCLYVGIKHISHH